MPLRIAHFLDLSALAAGHGEQCKRDDFSHKRGIYTKTEETVNEHWDAKEHRLRW